VSGDTWAILGTVVAVNGAQAAWVLHALGGLGRRIDQVEVRLAGVEGRLTELGERVARIEGYLVGPARPEDKRADG
jgi:hypothetical protein